MFWLYSVRKMVTADFYRLIFGYLIFSVILRWNIRDNMHYLIRQFQYYWTIEYRNERDSILYNLLSLCSRSFYMEIRKYLIKNTWNVVIMSFQNQGTSNWSTNSIRNGVWKMRGMDAIPSKLFKHFQKFIILKHIQILETAQITVQLV